MNRISVARASPNGSNREWMTRKCVDTRIDKTKEDVLTWCPFHPIGHWDAHAKDIIRVERDGCVDSEEVAVVERTSDSEEVDCTVDGCCSPEVIPE